MPQKYEQFTPQLLPRYWRSPKMRFMNVNGDAYLCFLDFHCQTVMKPLKQEAMVLVWLCLFITHTHTQSPKVQGVSSSAGPGTNAPAAWHDSHSDSHARGLNVKRSLTLSCWCSSLNIMSSVSGLVGWVEDSRSGDQGLYPSCLCLVWWGSYRLKNTEKLSFM